jgi:gp16 family phage-associated protein
MRLEASEVKQSMLIRPVSVQSLEQTKQWFVDHGVSVAGWAKAHGFRPQEVYALLNGKTRGLRGSSHRVAVALGVKAVPRPGSGPLAESIGSQVLRP